MFYDDVRGDEKRGRVARVVRYLRFFDTHRSAPVRLFIVRIGRGGSLLLPPRAGLAGPALGWPGSST